MARRPTATIAEIVKKIEHNYASFATHYLQVLAGTTDSFIYMVGDFGGAQFHLGQLSVLASSGATENANVRMVRRFVRDQMEAPLLGVFLDPPEKSSEIKDVKAGLAWVRKSGLLAAWE